jgi:hypothetical protein
VLTYSSDACGDLTGETAGTSAVPLILGQPVDQVVDAGDFTSFSVVVAVTSGVTFQWTFNGTDIAGATGDSLLLHTVSAANVGDYSVTVTNSAGTVTSSTATLALDTGASTPPPQQRLIADSDVGGSVTVSPIQRNYGLGEPVTLTAAPTAPSVFAGWSGISTGQLLPTTNPVIIPMTAGDITVRARFASPVPLAQGMVAFWRGETDATDLISGYSGAFYTGTTTTTPSVTAWGKVGGAFSFDGTTYVQVPAAPALLPPQITLEAWVYPTTVSTVYQTVIGCGSPASANQTWWLGILNGIPEFISHGSAILAGPAAVPLNTWTHLAATFDGATKVLYVNGTQVASQGRLGALTSDPAPVPVTIGAAWQASAPADLFTGLIDEISLYDRALTCDEIFDIYNADIAGKNTAAPYFTTSSPLPAAATNATSYTQQLATVLGTPPGTFTLAEGALPPGMTLSPAGTVTGASTVPGTFDFTVTARDAAGNATEQLYVLPVDAPVAPPPGLVSWWRGEPTTSPTVLDSIDGNNGGFYAGTTPAAPSYTADGEVGGAFAFDGTIYVQIPDAPSLQPAQITLEGWVYPTVLSASFQIVIARSPSLAAAETWWLGLHNGIPQFFTHSSVLLAAPAAIPLHTWTHLAATFDGATKVLYVNGAQVASQGGLGPLVYAPVPVGIGATWQNKTPAYLFTGRIDEVSLYNRALTPAEIGRIVAAGPAGKNAAGPYITTAPQLAGAIVGQPYTQTFTSVNGTPPVTYTLPAASTPPPGLTLTPAGVLSGTSNTAGVFGFTVVATDAAAQSDQQACTLQVYQSVTAPAGIISWWKAEGNALDSADANDGTLQGGAGYAAGEVGQAFALDGSSGHVQIPDAPNLQPPQITLEAWVYPTQLSASYQTVIGRGSATTAVETWWLGLHNGIPQFFTHSSVLLAAPAAIPLHTWTHLAATFDGATKVLYANGTQVASQGGLGPLVYAAVPVGIGATWQNNIPSYLFTGSIDETTTYNRALTPAEVASIYNAGPAGKVIV